jgi:hypothetical protein
MDQRLTFLDQTSSQRFEDAVKGTVLGLSDGKLELINFDFDFNDFEDRTSGFRRFEMLYRVNASLVKLI